VSAPSLPARRFGQGAIATPANFVTLGRILLAVPTLLLMNRDGASWAVVSLWFVLSVTDSVDGWLARRDGTTRSGAFLDPVADKVIVLGGLVVLADRGDVAWLPVALIAAREVAVSVRRSLAGRRGVAMPARPLGKFKTFSQFVAVGLVVWPWTADLVGLQQLVLWAATALTVVSGVDLLWATRRATGARPQV
jgi:CDP-diacylglycerol--glycerol-3-phosphate 3-phosphatidyltransferase